MLSLNKPKRKRLASSRLLQSIAEGATTATATDSSDDDFIAEPARSKRFPSSGLSSASDRLNVAVRRGLSVVGNSSRPRELSDRFPFLGRSNSARAPKQRKAPGCWKIVPCCLAGPSTHQVPSKIELDYLCRDGLGTLWFTRDEDPLELDFVNAEELHFLILCLYPMMAGIPYQFCRAAGLGNKVIVPLHVNDTSYSPEMESVRPFKPYFTVKMLKEAVGRKGRLYIRPLSTLVGVRVSQLQAYTPASRRDCYKCNRSLRMSEITDHMYVCTESATEPLSETATEPPPSVRGSGVRGSALSETATEPPLSVRGSGMRGSAVEPLSETATEPPPSVRGSAVEPLSETATEPPPSVRGSVTEPPPSASGSATEPSSGVRGSLADYNYDHLYEQMDTGEMDTEEEQSRSPSQERESLMVSREIIAEQDQAYDISLRVDREKDRQRLISRQMTEDDEMDQRIEQVVSVERQRRVVEWHRRIRRDLADRVPAEPPPGTMGVLHTRIRFPDGSRNSRQFLLSDPINAIRSFVGSHESINPRQFRVLVSDGPVPTELPTTGTGPISQLGLSAFIVLIGENRVTEVEVEPVTTPPLTQTDRERLESVVFLRADSPVNEVEVEMGSVVIDLTDVDTTNSRLSNVDEQRASVRSHLLDNGVHFLHTHRHEVVSSVINAYSSHPNLHNMELKVKFLMERGVDGGGLRRELCNCFWTEYGALMDGALDHVPQVLPNNQSTFYHIGRFISHGYVMTGYFPINLSIVSVKIIICGQSVICDEELRKSFSRFIDPFEVQAVKAPNEEALKTVITPMLSRFNVFAIPTVDTLNSLLKQAAWHVLVTKPFYALCEIRRGMLDAHPSVWKRFSPQVVDHLYDALQPSVPRVLAMIEEPTITNLREDATFDFLRRFINSLAPEMLAHFLSFVTGFSVCSHKKILVNFNQLTGFSRRPTSNTCSTVLHLPVTYESYATFSNEFSSLLNNTASWFFDAM